MRRVLGHSFVTSEITEEDIAAIMHDHPMLGAYGFGTFSDYHPNFCGNSVAELKRSRDQLLGSVEQCSNVCDWLYPVAKSKTINKRHTSYGLKYDVERLYKQYSCSNGTFVTAAIHMGFDWARCGSAAYFNFDQTSLDRRLATKH